jgi:hypothetical protein
MRITELIDRLAPLADILNRRVKSLPWRQPRHDQVEGLLALASEVQAMLVPVEPDPRYRRRLHGQLVVRGPSPVVTVEEGLLHQRRKGILIGAAAVGSLASIAGVILAYALHHRHETASRVAAG